MYKEEIGKTVLKDTKYILRGDIGDKAAYLGFDENTILDLAMEAGIYGEDGAGYTYIYRDTLNFYKNEDLKTVLFAILEECGCKKVMVLDDC